MHQVKMLNRLSKNQNMQELDQDKILDDLATSDYKYGFVTDVDTHFIDKGLNEDVIRLISSKR